jgi:autotransporter-associated beta strand protein
MVSWGASRAEAQLAAFPGAQGFGGEATGGRTGSIYVVTNLNDTGAGSFRDAVSASNRIIVFDVSGYINLATAVSCSSNLTILGQTAPGEGVGLEGEEVSFSDKSNDILQYMKFRQGSGGSSSQNSLALGNTTNVIVDHCSVEYGLYNNIDATGTNGSTNLTLQNSIIADPIKGQQFNMHTEGSNTTYLNNLWANAHNRNPLAKSNSQYVDNVVYNYQAGYTTGNSSGNFTYDIVNNYFIAGPSTTSAGDNFYQVDSNQSAYLTGTYLDSNKDGTLNGSVDTTPDGATLLTAPWSPETQFLPTLSAAGAYAFTLAHSGALYNAGSGTFGHDPLDAQTVSQVQSLGTAGTIYGSEKSSGVGFGTLPVANNSTGSLDTVPNAWLTTHGLSTTNASGLLLLNPLGYRMIEQYAQEAQDQYATQVATTGEWSTAAWTSATPGIYDHAQVRGTGTANGTVTISGADAASAFTVSIGGNGPAAGEALYVSGGSLAVQDTIYLGDKNNGTLAVSGGTVRADNLQLGNTVFDSNGNPTNYTGTFNFTGGTLQVGQVVLGAGTPGTYNSGGVWSWSGGTLQAFGTLNVTAPATLTGTGATVNTVGPDGVTYAGTMSGVLGGSGGFSKIGAGTLTFATTNTYTGPTSITGGAILANVTDAISPSSTITVATAAGLQLANGVTIHSPVVIGGSIASEFEDVPGTANATLAGPISMANGAQFRVGDSGTGTLTFTGISTSTTSYTFLTKGNITYGAGGVLNETSSGGGITVGRNATQAVSVTVTGTGSAINVTKVAAGGTGLTLGSGSASYENPTVAVTVASGGAINVGPSYVNLDADPTTATGTIATLNLNGGGTLTTGGFTDGEAGVNTAVLNLNGGAVVAGGNDPAGSTFLPAFSKLSAVVGSGGAVVNDAGFSITVAQPLTSAGGTDGGLTKSGQGVLTLTAANTYTGATNVSAGTLRVNNATGSGTGTGAVTVRAGATLGGSGTISGAVTVAGTIAPGATDSAVGTLATGGETWSTGGALAAQVSSSGGTGATVAGNDELVLSSLSVASLTTVGAFGVNVSVIGTDTPTLPVGTALVVANDKDTSAASDPFASTAVLSKLSLSTTGVQAPSGYALALATRVDPTSGGGYDLILTDVAAAPEPTSLFLAGIAAVPLVVGRRRRSV